MVRTPLYGGERGIRNRNDIVTKQLRTLAKSDFMHDFGEDIDTRDKYTQSDNIRFIEIARGYGIGQVKAATTAFNSVINQNPYKLVGKNISAIYPIEDATPDPTEFQNESRVLLSIGLDYDGKTPQSLKKRIIAAKGRMTPADILRTPIDLPGGVTINIPGGGTRNYSVRGIPMKVGTTPNISTLFHKVTGGKTKFALIIDAAGGLSMTGLKNTDLTPLPDQKCEFYIIENIENDSDSATKLKNFDKPKNAGNEALAPTLSFLIDVKDTVVYPPFDTTTQKDPAEVLFGNATMVLSRAGDETEADFTFTGDNTEYHIENVSQNANVKNASLNLLASAVNAGFVIQDGLLIPPSGSTTKQPFLFPYIKRVGDWCQALSLLDTSREYAVYDQDHTKTATITTLRDLKKEGVEVAIVTLDRILLAYALSIGIDVFFTTGNDLGLLLHFKNTETELSDAELQGKNDEMLAQIHEYETPEKASRLLPNADDVKNAAIQSIKSATNELEYIKLMRAGLYRASVRRDDFVNLEAKIVQLNGEIATAGQDVKILNRLLFDKMTILKKLEVDYLHNQTQIASITTYPTLALDNPTYETMRTRPESRAAITRLQMIIKKDMFNDVVQSKDVFLITYIPFTNPQYSGIWEAFKVLQSVAQTEGPMRGGVLANANGLRQFVITPLSEPEYNQRLDGVDRDEPLPLVLGSYYRDKKAHPYTVVNQFMITKEDLPIFQQIQGQDFAGLPSEDREFLAYRLLLLYADMLRGELEGIAASEDDIVTPQINPADGTELVDGSGNTVVAERSPSSTKQSNIVRVYYTANQLLATFTNLLILGKTADAFVDAFQTYNGVYLLDNDAIRSVAVGRDSLRPQSDDPYGLNQTLAKIQTLRESLMKRINPASVPTKKRGREQELASQNKIRNIAGTGMIAGSRPNRTPHARKRKGRKTRRARKSI